MKVRVLFFAQLKESFARAERVVQTKEGITVGELVRTLTENTPLKATEDLSIKFAVNEEFAEPQQVLKDQDTLALIPPTSGG